MRKSDRIGRHRRAGAPGLEHAALLYADDAGFVEGVADHVREGVEADEVVLLALPADHLAAVRAELGDDGGRVHLQQLDRLGRNPARLLPALRAFLDEFGGADRRVRVVGETCWPGRSGPERAACLEQDALATLAFDGADMSLLCPYDTRGLTDDERADACAVHPHTFEDHLAGPNPNHGDPLKLAEAAAGPLPEPPDVGETLVFSAPLGPRTVRRAVADHARRAGLSADRVSDLCLAVHEVAVNTVVHTDGPGILSLWTDDDSVVAEIQDGGHITDPLAGRYPPGPTDGRGYGLYLTHHLCDLVRVHTTRDAGTTVRMSMRLER